jgi:hypothetical protein
VDVSSWEKKKERRMSQRAREDAVKRISEFI